MAQHLIDMNKIKEMMWTNLMIMMGYDIENPEEYDKVRDVQARDGNPAWDIKRNIIFFDVSDIDDPWDKAIYRREYEDKVNNQLVLETEYNSVLELKLTIYGPDSYNIAHQLKHNIFLPQYKRLFSEYYFYPNGIPAAPVQMTESFNGQWWERWDLRIRFYQNVIRQDRLEYFSNLDIAINTDNGIERIIKEEKE